MTAFGYQAVYTERHGGCERAGGMRSSWGAAAADYRAEFSPHDGGMWMIRRSDGLELDIPDSIYQSARDYHARCLQDRLVWG